MMKLSTFAFLAAGAVALFAAERIHAEGNQVFYRYGQASLTKGRGTQVFTDTNAANGVANDKKAGWNLGAGLDIQMMKGMGPGDLLGEIQATYSHYSANKVRQTSTALLSQSVITDVTVAGLEVVVAPKYRLSLMEGKLRPWIIPVGLGFLVNSPPSNDTTYLDIGLQFGVGVEYALISALSLGIEYRFTSAFKEPNIDTSHSSLGMYAGINF